jgi:hypothetical protein
LTKKLRYTLTLSETMRYIIEEPLHTLKVNPMADTQKTVVTPVVGDRNAWKFGFTSQAELWNGRFAMIGFVAALATEYATGKGVLAYWGLM